MHALLGVQIPAPPLLLHVQPAVGSRLRTTGGQSTRPRTPSQWVRFPRRLQVSGGFPIPPVFLCLFNHGTTADTTPTISIPLYIALATGGAELPSHSLYPPTSECTVISGCAKWAADPTLPATASETCSEGGPSFHYSHEPVQVTVP